MEIFLGDLPFLAWLIFQTLLYFALTATGLGLVILRPSARIPAVILLCADALVKLLAPPVTRTDVGFAVVSLVIAAVLAAGPLVGLFQIAGDG